MHNVPTPRHEAYSCDIEPCSGGHPEWHIQADVIPLLDGNYRYCKKCGQKLDWSEDK